MGKQHQGMDSPGVREVPEDSGERREMEETGCEVICGAPTALAVKGQVKNVKKKIFMAPPLTSQEETTMAYFSEWSRVGAIADANIESSSAKNPETSHVLALKASISSDYNIAC